MITVVRGNEKITCSYKTYDEQLRHLGYVPEIATKKEEEKAETFVESTEEEVVEIPEKVVKEETVKVEEEAPKKEEKKTEEEKIGSKYGVRRRTTKKEA